MCVKLRPASVILILAVSLGAACTRQADPAPKPPPPLEYVGEWGIKGDGPGQLSDPSSLAVDSAGRVYIADAGSSFIHKFDPVGRPLLSFQDADVKLPDGLALDRGGAIYVVDRLRKSVVIFLPDGTRYREVRGGSGRRFRSPAGVVVDDDGNWFVVEAGGSYIQKFNSRGRWVRAWGKDGAAASESVARDAIATGPDGFVYVSVPENHEIRKFSREGDLVSSWACDGNAPAQGAAISGLAISDNYVFASDARNHRIRVWTLDGRQKLTDDLGGRIQLSTNNPRAVAVSPLGELLVLDSGSSRVLRFRINF